MPGLIVLGPPSIVWSRGERARARAGMAGDPESFSTSYMDEVEYSS